MALWNADIGDMLYFNRIVRAGKLKELFFIPVKKCAKCNHPFGESQTIWEPMTEDDGSIVHRYCYGSWREWGDYPKDRWPKMHKVVDGKVQEFILDSSWKPLVGQNG